ncbi:MAG: hypothetical protein ABI885_00445 [Gammaproteobacteria bacterium]
MPSDPTHPAGSSPADHRPAVWPWLLLPLVALTIFLVLSRAKEHTDPVGRHADTAGSASTSEDTGSR